MAKKADAADPHAAVRRYFDRDAARYPSGESDHPVMGVDYRRTRDALFAALEPAARDRVLEIGAGKGRWSRLVAPLVKSYTGIDISASMLATAREVTDAKGAAFEHADFLEWKHTGPSFDKVFSVRVIEYLRDKEAMAVKLAALTRPGGRVVLVTKTPASPFRVTGYARWAWKHRVRRSMDGTEGAAGDPGHLWWELIPPGRLARLLRAHGFEDVRWGPVVLRPPLFASTPGDLPVVPQRVQPRLVPSLQDAPLGPDARAARLWTRLSESYILVATRSASSKEGAP